MARVAAAVPELATRKHPGIPGVRGGLPSVPASTTPPGSSPEMPARIPPAVNVRVRLKQPIYNLPEEDT